MENLRTRLSLSNYGRRRGRIFETVFFKTDKPEGIVNQILRMKLKKYVIK